MFSEFGAKRIRSAASNPSQTLPKQSAASVDKKSLPLRAQRAKQQNVTKAKHSERPQKVPPIRAQRAKQQNVTKAKHSERPQKVPPIRAQRAKTTNVTKAKHSERSQKVPSLRAQRAKTTNVTKSKACCPKEISLYPKAKLIKPSNSLIHKNELEKGFKGCSLLKIKKTTIIQVECIILIRTFYIN